MFGAQKRGPCLVFALQDFKTWILMSGSRSLNLDPWGGSPYDRVSASFCCSS